LFGSVSGGVAALNPRLIADIPSGWLGFGYSECRLLLKRELKGVVQIAIPAGHLFVLAVAVHDDFIPDAVFSLLIPFACHDVIMQLQTS
jgi:hypothetical protein